MCVLLKCKYNKQLLVVEWSRNRYFMEVEAIFCTFFCKKWKFNFLSMLLGKDTVLLFLHAEMTTKCVQIIFGKAFIKSDVVRKCGRILMRDTQSDISYLIMTENFNLSSLSSQNKKWRSLCPFLHEWSQVVVYKLVEYKELIFHNLYLCNLRGDLVFF